MNENRIRHFISMEDVTPSEMHSLISRAENLKTHPGSKKNALNGKTLAMLFEKNSLRTNMSFQVGIQELGGYALMLQGAHYLSRKEDAHDTAKTVGQYAKIFAARVYRHSDLKELAKHSEIPLINALSDEEHPCQALADLMTLKENGIWKGKKIAYVGDGNNVCNSLVVACAMAGINVSVATPKGYGLKKKTIETAKKYAKKSGAKIEITNEPKKAVKNANAVYTDVWVSMGQEKETKKKIKDFAGFQVNEKLMKKAGKNAIFMHCMPVLKGYEASKEVAEGKRSVIFQQAENRMHVQKALMLKLLGK